MEISNTAIESAARALADAESSLPWESFDMEYVRDFRLRARVALSAAGPVMVAELADRFDAQAKRLLHTCETEFKSSTECVIASIRADTLKKVAAELREEQ